MATDDIGVLLRALDTGDIELHFQDGRSIKAHAVKLKLASLGGVLHNLMEDVMEDQIAAKRMKTDEAGGGCSTSGMPALKVTSLMRLSCTHIGDAM